MVWQDRAKRQFRKIIERRCAVAVMFGTETENMSKSFVEQDRLYTEQGRIDEYVFSLSGPKDIFTTEPAVNDILTVDGVVYRVIGKGGTGLDVGFRLDMGTRYAKK